MRFAHVIRTAGTAIVLGTLGALAMASGTVPAHALSPELSSTEARAAGGVIAPLADDPVTSLTLDRFDAVFDLHRDAAKNSSMTVTETIAVRFPDSDENHGIERAIPTYNQDIALHPQIDSVTDAQGNRLAYTTVDSSDAGYGDDMTVLRIGDKNTYVHGAKTYVLRYTLRNVVWHFADTNDADSTFCNPARDSRFTSSIFVAVATKSFSFCRPSRGPTSTIFTLAGIMCVSSLVQLRCF